jgi:hypothetical protein
MSPLNLFHLMEFPAHFPERCPPKTSSEAKGDLFRFVANKPPQATDFVSHHLLGKKYDKEKHCEACGLSVLVSEADVKQFLRATPSFRKKYVAKGRVSPDWGKIAQTGKFSHHTWWVPVGKSPELIFSVIEVQ